MERILFQIGIVEAAEDVAEAEPLWNPFELLVLLLVKGDVVILCYIADWG